MEFNATKSRLLEATSGYFAATTADSFRTWESNNRTSMSLPPSVYSGVVKAEPDGHLTRGWVDCQNKHFVPESSLLEKTTGSQTFGMEIKSAFNNSSTPTLNPVFPRTDAVGIDMDRSLDDRTRTTHMRGGAPANTMLSPPAYVSPSDARSRTSCSALQHNQSDAMGRKVFVPAVSPVK